MCCTNKGEGAIGKTKNIIHGITDYYGDKTISRDQFVEAIEAGISAVQKRYPDYPLPVDALREKAKYATEMDALTWKCKGSCGCPMTNVGVVTVIEDLSTWGSQRIDDAPSEFASAYDGKINSFFENGIQDDAVKLNIID